LLYPGCMNKNIASNIATMPRRYRWARLIHLSGLLYLGLLGWSRLILAWMDRALLNELGIVPGVPYLTIGGAVWGLVGCGAAVLLLVPRRWARISVWAAGLFFALSYWADRLFFVRAAQVQANWPFALFLTFVLLVFSGSLMFLIDQWEVSHGRR
jgi:hypothetical protein